MLRNIGVAWGLGLDELEILREPFLNLRFVFFAQALQFTHAFLHLLDDLGIAFFFTFAALRSDVRQQGSSFILCILLFTNHIRQARHIDARTDRCIRERLLHRRGIQMVRHLKNNSRVFRVFVRRSGE